MKVIGLIIAVFLFALIPCIGAESVNHIDKSSATSSEVSISTNPVCRSMIEHLENEIAETTASLKNCENQSSDLSGKALVDKTKECGQYEKKLELSKNNLSEVEEICAKGGTPDYLPKAIIAKPLIDIQPDNPTDNTQPKDSSLVMGLTADLKNYSPERTLSSNSDISMEIYCVCPDGRELGWMSSIDECHKQCAIAPSPEPGTGFNIWGNLVSGAKKLWNDIITLPKRLADWWKFRGRRKPEENPIAHLPEETLKNYSEKDKKDLSLIADNSSLKIEEHFNDNPNFIGNLCRGGTWCGWLTNKLTVNIFTKKGVERMCAAIEPEILAAARASLPKDSNLEVKGITINKGEKYEHHAVIVYPKGTDYHKSGVIFDPWLKQSSDPKDMVIPYPKWSYYAEPMTFDKELGVTK